MYWTRVGQGPLPKPLVWNILRCIMVVELRYCVKKKLKDSKRSNVDMKENVKETLDRTQNKCNAKVPVQYLNKKKGLRV